MKIVINRTNEKNEKNQKFISNSFRSNEFIKKKLKYCISNVWNHPYGTPYSTVNEKGTEDKSHKLLLKKPFTI